MSCAVDNGLPQRIAILFIGPLPPPVTGHSLACQVFLHELEKCHRVEVVNLSKSEFRQGISSASRIFEVIGTIWRVWRRRNECDVLYLTISESLMGNIKDLIIYFACFRQLSRMAIHLHGGAGMERIMSDDHAWLRRINEFFLRRLGAVVVLGGRHVPIFSRSVVKKRIHEVPNFAEDFLFAHDSAAVEGKFERIEPLRILFLSNLLPGKGHIELSEAVHRLDPQFRNRLRIDFAGGFESEEQKMAFFDLIADCPQMHYHGTVHGEAKRKLLSEAHLFCLPTYYPYEGQPISILEAYAAGCAVITTDHSGILDIFTHNMNGYQVAKKSVPSLRCALERALQNPRELREIAVHNWSVAQRRYRTAAYADALINIISALHDRRDLGTAAKFPA